MVVRIRPEADDYYTYADEVPLLPGQTLAYSPGRGYYAKGSPEPLSEHGKGQERNAARPASKQPEPISEHGRGGGSGATDTGAKPTPRETETGYPSSKSALRPPTLRGFVVAHASYGLMSTASDPMLGLHGGAVAYGYSGQGLGIGHLIHELDKHVLKPAEKYVIGPTIKEAEAAAKSFKISLSSLRNKVRHYWPSIEKRVRLAVPRIDHEIRESVAYAKDAEKYLPSAHEVSVVAGTLGSIAQVAALTLPFPADGAAELIAISLDTVSISAAAIDAAKHPQNHGKMIDFLVQTTIARFGVSDPAVAEEMQRIRAAAALVVQMEYDYLRGRPTGR